METTHPGRPLAGRPGSDRLVPLIGVGLLGLVIGGLLLGQGLQPDLVAPGQATVQVAPPQHSNDADRLHRLRTGADPLGPRLASALKLQPRSGANGSHGLVVTGAADPALLDAAGLKVGDVLVESDGSPLGPEGVDMISRQMASLDALEVMIERDGRQRRLTLLLRS